MPRRLDLVRTAALVGIVGLAACAGGVRGQTYWVNPGVGQGLQDQRFTIDTTECTAKANQLIPEPGQEFPSFGSGMQEAERRQNRRRYAVACMGDRGWQQRERIVGQ